MTLPVSGALSMSAINAEFGRGNNLNSYRGTTWFTDAGASGTFSSGAISMSEFYGKRPTSPTFSFTISSNQVNANLRTLAVNAGWNQSSAVVATIASNVYIYSNSTGTPGLTINGSWPGGLELVNNGFVMGQGGAGGSGAAGVGGAAGGPAISLGVSCSIRNNSYIGGGGGGGASGSQSFATGGGGGAGGGNGGANGYGLAGGAGGGPGSLGLDGGQNFSGKSGTAGSGGGGGRVMPGSGGLGGGVSPNGNMLGVGGGAGGGGGRTSSFGNPGGTGGSAGNVGGNANSAGAGGGGWGASGGTSTPRAGGAGGRAVQLNGFSVTWLATGTRYGAIS